jgi:hypothetical protein
VKLRPSPGIRASSATSSATYRGRAAKCISRDFDAGAARIAEFERLFPNFVEGLEQIFQQSRRSSGDRRGPGDFKAPTAETLRDRIFQYLSEFNLRAKTKSEFLNSAQGYE